jgi:cell division septation protein DedD
LRVSLKGSGQVFKVSARARRLLNGLEWGLTSDRRRISAIKAEIDTPGGGRYDFLHMEQKQRFFIYDRKEMGVLILLGILVAVFAFTLGVHLGKRVLSAGAGAHAEHGEGEHAAVAEHASAEHGAGEHGAEHGATEHAAVEAAAQPLPTVPDAVPNRQELNEQAKGAQAAGDESLGTALKEEVDKTGIRLENTRQTELPEKPKSIRGGATTSVDTRTHAAPAAPPIATAAANSVNDSPAVHRAAPSGKFTLQIGSFPAFEEARDQSESLEALGMKPFLRPAEVKGRRWFRIFVGGFETREAAEKAGARFVARHMIEAYVVAKMVEP